MKSHKTALVIIPPDDCCAPIQAIRRENDKAYARWMPHINLLYPFVDDTVHSYDMVAQRLARVVSDMQPFTVHLTKDSFGHFSHGKRSTVWVKPLTIVGKTEAATESVQQKSAETSVAIAPAASASSGLKTSIRMMEPMATNSMAPCINHSMSDVGIDALKDAVWIPDEPKVEFKRPSRLEAGLDCLRYAIWTPENTHSEQLTGGHEHSTDLETPTFGKETAGGGSNGDPEPDLDRWIQISKKSKKKGTTKQSTSGSDLPSDVFSDDELITDHVIKLQARFERQYVECSDLSSMSPEGFQPHLTLGQCDTSKVETFVKGLRRNWKDMKFEVKEVHIIARKGQTDAFRIVRTIPVGMKF